jgi:uncharacterized protein (DUF2235 family)
MPRNIVFCADGTWNNPGDNGDSEHVTDPTNVYKLFLALSGGLSPDSLRGADEQEKEYFEDGRSLQIAKYIHGVGDSRNPIRRLMGGAFGAGVIARIVRGYTFISRNYEPGCNIYIVGFSRGAYTARALAGLIASQGVLKPALTVDKEAAYRSGAQAWYRYRSVSASNKTVLATLAEAVSDLPAFLSRGSLQDSDLISVDQIAAVGVWDTVGALGFPQYLDGQAVDAFQFTNMKLSAKVRCGLHAVSLDEMREDFTPTLWDAAPNIEQTLFPGAHADVGGGYPMANGESGLSDNALQWVIDRLRAKGVYFSSTGYALSPNASGPSHQPWSHTPFSYEAFRKGPRSFAATMAVHPFVLDRIAAGDVVAEPGSKPGPYHPLNLPNPPPR